MSRREQDMRAEQELTKFLDENLYDALEEHYTDVAWRRNNDKATQLLGVDGYLTLGNNDIVVDEKATLYYINRNLPTFAFEINSYQKGRLTPGWLFNPSYLTDYYMLVYPNATHNDLSVIKAEDFVNCTCILVERRKIIEHLESFGYTQEKIEADATIYRRQRNCGKLPIDGINDFYYYLSYPSKYSEIPFNVIIRRNVLEQLARHIYLVNQGNVTIQK